MVKQRHIIQRWIVKQDFRCYVQIGGLYISGILRVQIAL